MAARLEEENATKAKAQRDRDAATPCWRPHHPGHPRRCGPGAGQVANLGAHTCALDVRGRSLSDARRPFLDLTRRASACESAGVVTLREGIVRTIQQMRPQRFLKRQPRRGHLQAHQGC